MTTVSTHPPFGASDGLEGLLESAPGLPGPLPPGESILWQGGPDWRLMAVHVMHVRPLLAATGLFTALSTVAALAHGADTRLLVLAFIAPLLGGLAAAGLATLSAWLLARVSRYTVTDARVVLRVGLIVPINLNIPFGEVTDVAIRPLGGGAGDLPLKIRTYPRMYYMLLWPHVRPFRFRRVEPMLRSLRDGEAAGQILAEALRRAHAGSRPLPARTARRPVPAPVLIAAE